MTWCSIFSCFPRYKAYTQINTMMWDAQGNYGAEPVSSHPRFPAPSNPRNAPQMRQPTYPAPFIPLGVPPAPPGRPTPNTHTSYHTFPRSTVVYRAPATSLLLGGPVPSLGVPTSRSVPANTPSRHHPSYRHHSNRHGRHHPQSLSAATSRHVHYADEMFQPRSRQMSTQSSRGVKAVPVATTSRHYHTPVAQQTTQGHRRRAHSTGNATAPVGVNIAPSQFQKAHASNGHEYSRCTGRKKALCIGINYIGQKRELHGCINDIKNVKRFLTRQWGFKDGDIVMLMDQTTNPRQLPTRKNMIDAMKWLVKDARPHDSLFFHYSGHGGQIPDTHGDETNGFDEVIYPVDYKKAGVIIDDELHRIMVKPLPRGCRLTAVFDSCHSGTTLDLPFMYHHDGRLKESHLTERALPQRMSSADVISFAACRDDQTSADTVQGGVAVGAMSYAFLTALTRKPVQSYLELLLSIREIVQPHFQQKAQLSSGHYI
ncbi:caspase domain-containing protein, partial [Boletus edulis BED1]